MRIPLPRLPEITFRWTASEPPTVVFVGRQESDGKRITVAFGTEESQFRAGPDPVMVQGVMMEGMGFFNRNGFRMLGGTATFEAAGMEVDDIVSGRMEVDIVQIQGDM